MRISDLSSDVCSSDLAAGLGDLALGIDAQKIAGMLGFPCPLEGAKPIVDDIVEDVELVVARCRILDDEAFEEGAQRRQVAVDPEVEDRKRVVSGKRVSVRVALGGGRIVKKKTQN